MATLPFGVPALLGDVAALFLPPGALMIADTFLGYGAGQPPLWGIFSGGQAVVVADTVLEFDYKQDWAIADYPVERGGFESYDKVNTPFHARIQFATGGSEERRQALLDSISAVADTLELLDVVTPEAVYVGVNIDRYEYRRTARNGLGLMVVNVGVIEIREEGVTDFKNTKPPSGYAAQQAGTVQSQAPTASIEGLISQLGIW